MFPAIPTIIATPWVFMWVLAFAIYGMLKVISLLATADLARVPAWKRAAYLFAWPGMDAATFLGLVPVNIDRPGMREWLFATAKLVVGVIAVRTAAHLDGYYPDWVAGWLGMIGIAFVLHFGLFDLISCGWRSIGIAAVPLMDWPIASHSVTEFWGKRWNRAFRDLTFRFLFRPLASRLGTPVAMLTGFVVSGLIHDLVISWPAGGGYGWPTLFFSIQGLAVVLERSPAGRWLGLGQGLTGRVFCFATVLLPSPLLFHHAFLGNVIIPFIEVVGR